MRKVQDQEWFKPSMSNFKFACCDCGLTHTINFEIDGKRVRMQATRDPDMTDVMRYTRAFDYNLIVKLGTQFTNGITT